MAIDSTLPARNGMRKLLLHDAGVLALVPAGSIYTQWTVASPSYPLIKSGPPSTIPLRAACVDGQEIEVAWHAFSTGRYSGSTLVEPAEDHAGRILSAMLTVLDRNVIATENGRLGIRYIGSQLLQDPEEASAFHGVASFRVRAITA